MFKATGKPRFYKSKAQFKQMFGGKNLPDNHMDKQRALLVTGHHNHTIVSWLKNEYIVKSPRVCAMDMASATS